MKDPDDGSEWRYSDDPVAQVWWKLGLAMQYWDSSGEWRDRAYPKSPLDKPHHATKYRLKPKEIKSESVT